MPGVTESSETPGDTDGVFINSDEIVKADEDEGESESTIKNALSTENKDEKSKKNRGMKQVWEKK